MPDITRIRAYETHIDSIKRSIVEGATKQTLAKIEIITDYIAITRKAIAGQEISADDFNAAAERYNEKVDGLLGKHKDYISSITGVSDEERKQLFYLAEKIEKLAVEKSESWVRKWKNDDTEIGNIATNLDNAFISQHLSNAPSINLTMPDGINTPEKFISALLKNNPGIAIGDIHIRNSALNFLSDNMGNFKKSGVDTVYLEMGPDDFLWLSKLSVGEMKNILEEITPEKSKKISELWAEKYEAGRSDDYPSALVKLFMAAKENGIDIVYIDIKGEARDILNSARVPITNFVWTDSIKKDREQNHKTGKYAVFGGLLHFTGSGLNDFSGSELQRRGFVDDALGISVVAFDKREKDEGEFALRGTSANGADFYLPAGHCYIDNHKYHQIRDGLEKIPSKDLLEKIYSNSFPFNILESLKAEWKDSSECPQQPVHDAYTKQLETATQIAVDAEIRRINAYAELNKKSTTGKPVSANDPINVENTYHKAASPFEYIKRQMESDTSGLSPDLKGLFNSFDKARLNAIKEWKAENPVINREAIDGMELKFSDADKTTMKQPTQVSVPYPTQQQPHLNK